MDDAPLLSLLALLGSPATMLVLLSAVPLGMVFGALPGLGGKIALAVFLPVAAAMEPVPGAVFLLSLHAVVHTGSAIPSILFGVPGTGPSAATVLDGYPMARAGRAGTALGASLAASAVGGVVGAIVLAALMPVVRPLILSIGVGEYFLLAVLGIVFIATVSGHRLLEGTIVGMLGLMAAFIGTDPHTGTARFTFGQLALWDGIDVVTAVVGVLALPEILSMSASQAREGLRSHGSAGIRSMLDGLREVLRHPGLTLRSSGIGAVIGLVPGLGGEVASWVTYGHAMQGSREPERFGKGAVEGVIAPEAANNAKEGGSLLPTLGFGVPGSSGMALLLGGFVMLGITPGPQLLTDGHLVWTLIWTLVLANLVSVAAFFALAPALAALGPLSDGRLLPFALVLAILGSLLSTGHAAALPLLLLFGLLGWLFKLANWPRAPFVIGLVLGPLAETSLHQALAIWGPGFLLRPSALFLLALILACVAWDVHSRRTRLREHARAAAT